MLMVVYTYRSSLPALNSATIERIDQVPVRRCPLVRKRDLSLSFLLLLLLVFLQRRFTQISTEDAHGEGLG
jgi:hypothetical protein